MMTKINYKFWSRFYLLLCWALAVFMFLTMPLPDYQGPDNSYYDKVIHAILFGILALLIVRVLVLFNKLNWLLIISLSVLLSAVYSGLAEYLQAFIPGRTVSEKDFLAGMIGVFIASIIAYEKYQK